MCGIAGIVKTIEATVDCVAACGAMQGRLRHRGPDDAGIFADPSRTAALAHTRLSIQDLSAAGQQPMTSADNRYVIVFNGEIYNFPELRAELIRNGAEFRSHTDTEVVLQLFAAHGPEFLQRLEGMFAIAIWDTLRGSLLLARDPLGIKPLYLWRHRDSIAFASEIRAILQANIGPRELDVVGLFDYLRLGSVQEPRTLVKSVSQLPPGHYMIWSQGSEHVEAFWELSFSGSGDSDTITDPLKATKLTRRALERSVDRHFVSDVPVGIFLSGGLDSTAILALARSVGRSGMLRSFCISFDEQSYDEGSVAARTAQRFGADHTDVRLRESEGAELLDGYLYSMDQPSNDGFNTWCVAKVAHQHGMKVVLSGLGGDEIFGGYPTFQKVPQLTRLHRLARWLPGQDLAGRLLQSAPFGQRARRIGSFLRSDGGVRSAWEAMRGFFTEPEALRLVAWLAPDQLSNISHRPSTETSFQNEDELSQLGALELTGYMLNQLLRESDVMSMAWGLELRVPFVDRSVIDTVGRIHSSIRFRQGKRLLSDAVPEIPDWVLTRPKQGFRFPFELWAQNSWRPIFDSIRLSSPVVCDTWYRLWAVFVLARFLEVNEIGVEMSESPQSPTRRAA